MGRVKKPVTPMDRLLAKALERPEATTLIENDRASFKQRSLADALRAYPDESKTPLVTDKTIKELIFKEAVDAEIAKTERLTKVAKMGRKGLSLKLIWIAADAYARNCWNAGLPVDSRGWRTGVANEANIQLRTLKSQMLKFGINEEELLIRLRSWKPSK